MPIRQGTANLKRKFIGASEVLLVYVGATLIYKAITKYVSDYSARVLADGGTVEGLTNLTTLAQNLRNIDSFERLTLLFIPSGVKASKAYVLLPEDGAGDLTIVRNTTATRSNSNLVDELVGLNVPRLNYDTVGGQPYLLLEPQRTNIILNSATLSTQSITTTAQTHTLSFKGTGTVTLSGSFAGSLVGTGANNRVALTFTSTASTLTVTVSGSCTDAQIEIGLFATSNIPTTSAAVTRNQDAVSKTGISTLIGQTEGVIFIEAAVLFNDGAFKTIGISDGTTANRLFVQYTNTTNQLVVNGNTQGVGFPSPIVHTLANATLFSKIVVKYTINKINLFVDGVKIINEINNQALPINFSRFGLDTGSGGSPLTAKLRQAGIGKTAPTDAECITLST